MLLIELKFKLKQHIRLVENSIYLLQDFDLPELKNLIDKANLRSSPLIILPSDEELIKIKKLKTINDAINVIELYIEKIKENLITFNQIQAEADGFEYFSNENLSELGFSEKQIKEIRKTNPYFEDVEDIEENDKSEDEKIDVNKLDKLRFKTLREFDDNQAILHLLKLYIEKNYRLILYKRYEERQKQKKKNERSGKDEVKDEEEILDINIDGIHIDEIEHGFRIIPNNPKSCEVRTLEQLRKYADSYEIDLGKAKTKKDVCNIILEFLNEEVKNKPVIEPSKINNSNFELSKYPNIKKFGERKNIDKIPYKYVSGLLSFEVYEHPEWNKIIYILGEQHNYKNLCSSINTNDIINASNLFFSLLDSTDKKLDVFLELDYKTTKIVPKERFLKARFSQVYNVYLNSMKGYMFETNNILAVEGCFKGSEKTGCDYYKDHIRFHLSDVRDIETDVNTYLYEVFHFMEYRFLDELSRFNVNQIKYFYEDVVKKYEKYNNIKVFKDEVEKALLPAKVIKQLMAIDPKYKILETTLYKELSNNINNNLKVYQPKNLPFKKLLKLKQNERITQSLKDEMIVSYNNFIDNRGHIFSIFMDMYLLFRLFKTFKTTDEKVKETKNVIIYAGNAHAQFYHQVLSKIGFNRTFSANKVSDDERSCLDISSLQIKWL